VQCDSEETEHPVPQAGGQSQRVSELVVFLFPTNSFRVYSHSAGMLFSLAHLLDMPTFRLPFQCVRSYMRPRMPSPPASCRNEIRKHPPCGYTVCRHQPERDPLHRLGILNLIRTAMRIFINTPLVPLCNFADRAFFEHSRKLTTTSAIMPSGGLKPSS
jgi:hypothetical protein